MDRNDSNRQSSLPSSLIPHLYTAPQQPRDSSTRTTLDPRPVSPIFPLYTPPDARPISPVLPLYSRHTAWRENEPGPSSLAQPIPRRLESYPLRIPERHDYMRETERDYRNMSDRDYRGRDYLERDYRDYWQQSGAPYNMQQPSTSSSSSYSFQALPPPQILLNPNPEDPSASSFSFDRHDPYTYPPIGSLSISAPTSTRFRSPESPDIYHPMYRYRSDSRSADVASNDGDGSQSGKRRRAESLEADDNTGKARNTRKTAVACNFCRGRKLRCNGAKPSCYNCTVRKFECEYVPIQRRRGPGKAKRGTRPKKTGSVRSDTSRNMADHPPVAVPEYELDALAPELRPYTSVLSLDNYQPPPDLVPNYGLQSTPAGGEYYSRLRTSRSRESSEDRSEAEELHRN